MRNKALALNQNSGSGTPYLGVISIAHLRVDPSRDNVRPGGGTTDAPFPGEVQSFLDYLATISDDSGYKSGIA
jgi:hypothetical protein